MKNKNKLIIAISLALISLIIYSYISIIFFKEYTKQNLMILISNFLIFGLGWFLIFKGIFIKLKSNKYLIIGSGLIIFYSLIKIYIEQKDFFMKNINPLLATLIILSEFIGFLLILKFLKGYIK